MQALQQELEAAEESQKSLLSQFSEVIRRRETVNREKQPLLDELNKVKTSINEFNDRKEGFVVSATMA